MIVRVSDFTYRLPPDQIAQSPARPRDNARLLVVDRQSGILQHRRVRDLAELLTPRDVLVVNQTKVYPARLRGTKISGGKVEVLLLSEIGAGMWEALSKPGLGEGTQVTFRAGLRGEVVRANNHEGILRIKFEIKNLKSKIDQVGEVPLPPYIHSTQTQPQLKRSYQTVYAREWGSAAAPTAGLHFTRRLLHRLTQRGVEVVPLTLHVGLGTFQPVTEAHVREGTLHRETMEITPGAAHRILAAKARGQRVIAVGTTTTRALESAAYTEAGKLRLRTGRRETNLFIKPPYQFCLVESLITNFHLPYSSLLMLVAALASAPNTPKPFRNFGESTMGEAYREAVTRGYRFFSFGDAMWIG